MAPAGILSTVQGQQQPLVNFRDPRNIKYGSKRNAFATKNMFAGMMLALLVIALVIDNHQADAAAITAIHARFPRTTVRLCSRSLSDALYLLCKDRGFNEPFSTSSEVDSKHVSAGPGLVEECCYKACSVEEMAQYCKPEKTSN